MVNKSILSLNSSIGDVANLFTVKLFPFLVVKLLNKWNNTLWVDEIDKCIANIALILEINWEVEEIITCLEFNIYCFQQHLLSILVGNVLYHESCSLVNSTTYFLQVKFELFLFLGTDSPWTSGLASWMKK